MLKGSLKEKSKLMQQVSMQSDEQICLTIFHNGVKIGEKVLSIRSIEMMIPAEKDKDIMHKIEFTADGGKIFNFL